MKLRFKHQKFQSDAVNATLDVFSGQPNRNRRFLVDQGDVSAQSLFGTDGWANAGIHLTEDNMLKNLREVQKQQGIMPVRAVQKLNGKPCFTIEMETGTGKTYTYIKTMYELNAKYGWNKFIIVVPSVAIREGVYKSFQVTADHFKEDYGQQCRFFIYKSSRLNELDQFVSDSSINVMIINTQAFNARGKDANRIKMKLDSFRSRRPIDVVASANPIIIIDEPQSVIGTEKSANATRESIQQFNPLFYLNYSATHRENFNMIYRLDAVDAYQKHLVKKITVKGISVVGSTATNGYLYLQKINVYPNKQPDASVVIEYNAKTGGGIRRIVKKLSVGDNIYIQSGEIEAYRDGFTVASIDARKQCVEFSGKIKNDLNEPNVLYAGEIVGDQSEDDVRRIQIRETILSHLEKERELYQKDIKVLSLFFVDEVAKYKDYDASDQKGEYAKIFEEEYANAIDQFMSTLPFGEDENYRSYLKQFSVDQIHAGYFSIDKKGKAVNSEVKRGESESNDTDAYDLIMRNKERLLSHDEPVRFIFSHSALREGWDNPNVFQICTLRHGSAEIKKRQEIGRGLRLCVNKYGERMDSDVLGHHDVHSVNSLTVIANESYESFASSLQDEFAEVIKNRPKEITPELFTSRIVIDPAGNEREITSSDAAHIYVSLKESGIVVDDQLSDDYLNTAEELRTQKLSEAVGETFAPFVGDIKKLIDSVYNSKQNPMSSDARGGNDIPLNLDQEKFASKAFKELWNRINSKTYYTVQFNEDKLINACVDSIDRNLRVTQTLIIITEGWLKSTGQDKNPEMQKLKGSNVRLEELANANVKFDLLDEISRPTKLTRKAIATILSKISPDRFKCFRSNPEEFIREVVKLINEQKSSTVIEHITYDLTNEKWDVNEIFTKYQAGQYGNNLIDTPKKHLYDKLRYDSNIEKNLAEELEYQDAIDVYVKLPTSFYINTPMGKYNPDWAIALKEGQTKHIYFVAETKGDISEMSLRKVEEDRIKCAQKHFAKINSQEVKYSVIASYSDLLKEMEQ